MTQTTENRDADRPVDNRPGRPRGAAEESVERADTTGASARGKGPTRSKSKSKSKSKPQGGPEAKPPSSRHDAVVLGAEPRVHLLPPEVIADRKAAVLRRRLGFGVIAVLALVALGVAGATSTALSAQRDLATEQAATQSLLKQELTYVKVRSVQDQVDLIKTAQQVGSSTEIAWMPYLQSVQSTLPPSVTITGVAVDSSTPIELYPQSTASLQGPRVATIVFTAQSSSLPEVPSWLLALKTLPGYADALPGSVNLDQSGVYTVTITMHVDQRAFSNRFAAKTGK